jgi:hypothetical protein
MAPSLEHLDSRGDFGADLAISGPARRDALKNVDIHGAITGGTWQVTGNTGEIQARSTASSWAANLNGNLKSLRVQGDASGLLAAHNIDTIDIKHNATGLTVLAGANLGSDAQLGGTGAAADTFTGATIKNININGNATNSTFAAGVNPTNSLFGDSDDVFLSPSVIGKMKVKGTTTNSFFLATTVNAKRGHHEGHDNEDQGNQGNGGGDDEGHNHQGNNGSAHVQATAKPSLPKAASRATKAAVGINRMFGL